MSENRVQIVIEGDARSAQVAIDGTGKRLLDLSTQGEKASKSLKDADASTSKLGQSAQSTVPSIAGLSQAVQTLVVSFAAYKIAAYIKDSALLAARYETLGVVMSRAGANAGYTKGEMDTLQASLEKQGIAAIEARQTLSKLAAAHMDLSKASAMARAAQDLAVVGGINSSEAFERFVYAIQSGQPEMLRTLGLNVNFEKSYKDIAKQLKVNVEQLTEAEKMQARTNVSLEAAKGYAGLYEESLGTAGKQIQQLKRHTDNLAVSFGTAFNPATSSIVKDITASIKELAATVKDPAFVLGMSGVGQFGASLFGALTTGGTAAIQVLGNTAARLTGIFIMVDAFINRHQADMDVGHGILTSGDPAKALQLSGTRARDRALTYGATPTGQAIAPGMLEAEFNIQSVGRKLVGPRELTKEQIEKARSATAALTVDLAKANDVSDEGAGKIAEISKKYDEYAKTLGKTNPLVQQYAVALGYARTHLGHTPAEVHKATEEVLKHTRALQGEIGALESVAGLYGEGYSDRLTVLRAETAAQEQYTEAIKKGVSAQDAMREKTVSLAKAQAEINARKETSAKGVAAGFAGPAYDAQVRDLTAQYDLAKSHATDRLAVERDLSSKLAALESQRLRKSENAVDGMRSSLLDYTEACGTAASRMSDFFNKGFKSAEDALSNFVGRGKLDIVSLFDTLRVEAARAMVVQPLLKGLSSGSLWSGFTGLLNSHGNVLGGDGISALSNGIYAQPTFFGFDQHVTAFARGGVLGEAGPEAVMPLTRDSSGNLSVRAQGGGDTFIAHIHLNMPASSGNQAQDKSFADDVGDAMQSGLNTWWEDRYRQAHRPGAIANGGVQL